ncbi:SIR2 family protein [Phormidium sp. LEGE 05292]|uniref:phosphorylase family protein n=1 Tax=[Phormidium] sp. LEGE 05292 TaxID=767427 RepID=UPI001881C12F|nr:SIR2 family protein [Phormidium sp. LEGE 05292]MBE9228821.1 SIR2 family protein [Phormidium sp. LEGE 05292]
MTSEPFHAVILTALPIEYKAVRAHLTDLQEETDPQGTVYEQGKFIANGSIWDVAIAQIGAGIIGAARATAQAINNFQPDVILFVGVAGGIKDVALGDVVAATKIYEYEFGKAEKKFKPRPEVGLSNFNLVQRARAEASSSDWQQRIRPAPLSTPKVHVAPIASGEKVIASIESKLFEFLRSNYEDAIAVEMEGFGFLNATHAHQQVSALVIRGISDLIFNKTEVDKKGYQEIAACHASAFAFQVLAKFIPPLTPPPIREDVDRLLKEYSQDFKKISDSLKKGRLIIFLGSGINSSPDTPEPKNRPPSDITIAKFMATDKHLNQSSLEELVGLPCEICPTELEKRPSGRGNSNEQEPKNVCPVIDRINQSKDKVLHLEYQQNLSFARLSLRCMSQYLINESGERTAASRVLRKLLTDQNYEPNDVQKYFADLALAIEKINRRSNNKFSQLIIMTTNYDFGLEKAFAEKELDIDILYYYVIENKLLHKSYKSITHEKKYEYNEYQGTAISQEYKELLPDSGDEVAKATKPIILKLYGGALCETKNIYSNFVITETEHFDFLNSLKGYAQVFPTNLTDYLTKSDILLIGYSANNTELKNILHCLFDNTNPSRWQQIPDPNDPYRLRGWLIDKSNPGDINNEKYWDHWEIKLIPYSWDIFIEALKKEIRL